MSNYGTFFPRSPRPGSRDERQRDRTGANLTRRLRFPCDENNWRTALQIVMQPNSLSGCRPDHVSMAVSALINSGELNATTGQLVLDGLRQLLLEDRLPSDANLFMAIAVAQSVAGRPLAAIETFHELERTWGYQKGTGDSISSRASLGRFFASVCRAAINRRSGWGDAGWSIDSGPSGPKEGSSCVRSTAWESCWALLEHLEKRYLYRPPIESLELLFTLCSTAGRDGVPAADVILGRLEALKRDEGTGTAISHQDERFGMPVAGGSGSGSGSVAEAHLHHAVNKNNWLAAVEAFAAMSEAETTQSAPVGGPSSGALSAFVNAMGRVGKWELVTSYVYVSVHARGVQSPVLRTEHPSLLADIFAVVHAAGKHQTAVQLYKTLVGVVSWEADRESPSAALETAQRNLYTTPVLDVVQSSASFVGGTEWRLALALLSTLVNKHGFIPGDVATRCTTIVRGTGSWEVAARAMNAMSRAAHAVPPDFGNAVLSAALGSQPSGDSAALGTDTAAHEDETAVRHLGSSLLCAALFHGSIFRMNASVVKPAIDRFMGSHREAFRIAMEAAINNGGVSNTGALDTSSESPMHHIWPGPTATLPPPSSPAPVIATPKFGLGGKDPFAEPRPEPVGINNFASGWGHYGVGSNPVNGKVVAHPLNNRRKGMKNFMFPWRRQSWNPMQNSVHAMKTVSRIPRNRAVGKARFKPLI